MQAKATFPKLWQFIPETTISSLAIFFPLSNSYLDEKKEAQVEEEEVASIRPTRQPGLSVRSCLMKKNM